MVFRKKLFEHWANQSFSASTIDIHGIDVEFPNETKNHKRCCGTLNHISAIKLRSI